MRNIEDNAVAVKSKCFALRCIKAYKHLSDAKQEFVLSRQLLRSGTGIGANVKEGLRAQSTADFISKLSIALKEASESEYWLELLCESDYLSKAEFESLYKDCQELIKLLTSIILTSKKNNK